MSQTEQHAFQAEIQQVLDIVIHSLYTDKEIFIRELVSNASDALEKLRFIQASGTVVEQPELPLQIRIEADEAAGTLTFTDTGIGMTRDELIENLGTIAHSGSKAFMKKLAEHPDAKGDATLIGQFGVGFYSAFMVADKVTVATRSHRPGEPAWVWTSEGAKGYTLEAGAGDAPRGTRIQLHLKASEKEFAEGYRLEGVLKRYSSFMPFPIEVGGKVLDAVGALWTRSKSEIKEEEYNKFYQFFGHDSDAPLLRLHFTADAPLSIQSLLFVPSRNLETLGFSRAESEVNLYCKKVLIQARAKGLVPDWLRFLKGVVDSEDLPLNISRETMQDSALVQKLNKVLTGRFLKHLEETSVKDPAVFEKFYEQFGRFLKEGIVNDYSHREALGRLLRYESSALPAGQKTTLAEVVKRMPAEQGELHYLVAASREAAEASPFYEAFASRKTEVLFLYDPWDEFVMDHLSSFEGKALKSAEKARLKAEADSTGALPEDKAKDLASWMETALAGRLNKVRVSDRLVDSPAAASESDEHMTSTMRRILKAMDREGTQKAAPKPDLEINPGHPLIRALESMRHQDAALATLAAEQVLDSAMVSAGLLEDPRAMLKRVNELLGRVLSGASGAR